jgi:uncharacterized protein (DUF305 family)
MSISFGSYIRWQFSGVRRSRGENGLMSEKQMRELDTADGSTAQRPFLEGMIRHHQGAVVIAEAGSYEDCS